MTWLVIRNPASGNRRRSRRAVELARERGYEVVETARPGDAVRLAAEAAGRGVERIAACGGDGTVNEVVRGVDAADRLASTTVAVIPTGTGNGFAEDVGIRGVGRAFDLLESGRDHRVDVGTAGDRRFLKSCVSGFPADVSARTDREQKRLLGVLAYGLAALPSVLERLQSTRITLPRVAVRAGPPDAPTWSGSAVLVLAGNSRRFPGVIARRADLTDGRLDAVVVGGSLLAAEPPRGSPDGRRPVEEWIAPHVHRLRVASLSVSGDAPVPFSLDGEVIERRHLRLGVDPRVLRLRVGPPRASQSN